MLIVEGKQRGAFHPDFWSVPGAHHWEVLDRYLRIRPRGETSNNGDLRGRGLGEARMEQTVRSLHVDLWRAGGDGQSMPWYGVEK